MLQVLAPTTSWMWLCHSPSLPTPGGVRQPTQLVTPKSMSRIAVPAKAAMALRVLVPRLLLTCRGRDGGKERRGGGAEDRLEGSSRPARQPPTPGLRPRPAASWTLSLPPILPRDPPSFPSPSWKLLGRGSTSFVASPGGVCRGSPPTRTVPPTPRRAGRGRGSSSLLRLGAMLGSVPRGPRQGREEPGTANRGGPRGRGGAGGSCGGDS